MPLLPIVERLAVELSVPVFTTLAIDEYIKACPEYNAYTLTVLLR